MGGRVISYADDTGAQGNAVLNSARAGIAKIKHWLDSFMLTLNRHKTNYIACMH